MTERTKEIILKTSLVLSSISLALFFSWNIPGVFFVNHFIVDENTAQMVFHTVFVVLFNCFGATGTLSMILIFVFGGIKSKPVKAERIPLKFHKYSQFIIAFQKALEQNGYIKLESLAFENDGSVTVYINSNEFKTLNCMAIIRCNELNDDSLTISNECITKIIEDYYERETIRDIINMISVFCVERITPTFRKTLNGILEQDIKLGRLLVGISFGGKHAYIAKQKDGFAVFHYKRLRNMFLNILNETNSEKGNQGTVL